MNRVRATTLLAACLLAASTGPLGGCGSPYYVEGQDALGDLPDSLRIQIEDRETPEGVRQAQGVYVRELGEGQEPQRLPLEYAPEGPYLLRRGDKVQVSVLFYPELQTTSVVRPDGMLTAPGVGDVAALGRRPEEVAADIEAYYSRLLRDPATTVNVIEFGARRAYIFGAVGKPGSVSLEQRMTLTQAIAESGSVRDVGHLGSVVLLRRRSENSARAYKLDLGGVLEGKSLAADVVLQPDDVVYVPTTFISNMELFVRQVFDGLRPIPELFIRTYDSIHVTERVLVTRGS